MTTLLAKTYIIPTIERVRTTCIGTQYVIATPEYLDIVTVNGASITCTCNEGHCDHIRTVERRRTSEAENANIRALHSALFDL